MADTKYYDGTKLLSMKDINGLTPEIFITTTNRSAGKTTYFNRLLVNRYKKQGKKFILLYRFNYELVNCADKFFKEIGKLFFKGDEMTDIRRANGIYTELFLNEKSCGYCISLNYADQLKKFSHLLADADCILFDEFQSETNHYCSNEIRKLISIHTSIARGNGEQVRRVPLYMLSNKVSLINPYFLSLGISDRLHDDTKYLKGKGFVMEQTYIESAAELQLASGFNKAFANEDYIAYAAQNVYLNDSNAFIDKPQGKSVYIATLKDGGHEYSIRFYNKVGLYYIDKCVDNDYKVKLSFDASSHDASYIMVGVANPYVTMLRNVFERGLLRFRNQECKSAFFNMLKYNK